MEWTKEDQAKAFAEGWGLFNIGTFEEAEYQIQRVDDLESAADWYDIEEFDQLFDTDAEAVSHVSLAATGGSLLHRVAMEIAQPGGSTLSDEVYRQRARQEYHEEGRIEVDEKAEVSRNEGYVPNGAYVQAWVWVEDN